MLAQRVSRLCFVSVVGGLVLLGAPGTASAAAPVCPTQARLYQLPAGMKWLQPRPDCTDADGDPINIMITDQPEFGTFDVTDPIGIDERRYYTAKPDAAGNRDVIKFKAIAGGEESNEFQIDVWIMPANNVPVCKDLALNVQAGTSVAIAPECTDADGDSFALQVTDAPDHGTFDPVRGTYTAAARYAGQDSMTFVMVERYWRQLSAPGTVTITVTQAPGQPTATGDKTAPTLDLRALKSRRALRRGIRLMATASEAGRIAIEAYISPPTARRAEIDDRRVGSLVRNVKAGKSTLKFKLYREARSKLAKLRRVKIQLVARLVDAAGNLRTKRLRITLQRR